MSSISFTTKLFRIKDWTILRLPEDVSEKLPSRGMIMVKGSINNIPFKTLLEPDGKYGPGLKPSHWLKPSEKLLSESRAEAGDSVEVSLEVTKEWVILVKEFQEEVLSKDKLSLEKEAKINIPNTHKTKEEG